MNSFWYGVLNKESKSNEPIKRVHLPYSISLFCLSCFVSFFLFFWGGWNRRVGVLYDCGSKVNCLPPDQFDCRIIWSAWANGKEPPALHRLFQQINSQRPAGTRRRSGKTTHDHTIAKKKYFDCHLWRERDDFLNCWSKWPLVSFIPARSVHTSQCLLSVFQFYCS